MDFHAARPGRLVDPSSCAGSLRAQTAAPCACASSARDWNSDRRAALRVLGHNWKANELWKFAYRPVNYLRVYARCTHILVMARWKFAAGATADVTRGNKRIHIRERMGTLTETLL